MTTRIVIIGGGFGGLEAAFSLKALLKRPFEITLVDRSAYHAFIPSIHLIVSGKASADSIRIPLKVVLGAAGMTFVQDEALAVNSEKREVTTGGGALAYDYLVISSGAENNYFGIPGANEFSYRFRTPEDAERIREKLVQTLSQEATCRFVLAGGGTEGVEVVGEVLDLIRSEGREEDLRAGRIAIDMIEGKTRLLPNFPGRVQDIVEEYLRGRGVSLLAGDRISEVGKDGVVLGSGQKCGASILVWSGGIQPSKLIRALPLLKDAGGWLRVTDRLHAPEDDRIYGIGDAVSISAPDGQLALQRLAYHAQDQARVAAVNVAADISGSEKVVYKPGTRPQLISLGRDMGIFTLEGRVYSGPWVVALKKAVERKHLMTYLSRPVSSAIWSVMPGAGLVRRLIKRMYV
jgi:NADH dehydrogenase FAD-containing subunit